MDVSAELNNSNNKMAFGPRIVRSSDPDVYSNPDSARVRARQIGCIGIRRYNNRDGSVSWMPCTNESDYRRVSGFGPSGRRFRRQQLEREVRQIIGRQDRRKPRNKSANYTKPELRETIKKRIMAGSKGGRPGQWSARKAQLLAAAYKKAGGGYKGGKSKTQRSLSSWTRQKWRTIDGKPAIRGKVTRRYLPAKAWDNLTPAQRMATNRKKIIGSKKGRQFIDNTRAGQNARKRSVRGQKHIEFHEDLEFKAIGPRKSRALRSTRSTASFGRRARRIGGALRAGLLKVPFDPNPIDADDDNIVQENTIHERPLIRRAVDAIRQTTGRVAQRMTKPFKKPEDSNQKPFSRAESMLDGRFIARAPQSLVQPRIAERLEQPSKRKIKKSRPAVDARRPQADVSAKPKDKITPTSRVLPKTDIDDEIDNLRNERKNIYNAFTVEGATIAQLADQFDVVRDEIRDAILKHEKSRSASLRGFRARNSKLFDSIKNFGNSKNVILEAIKERKVKDWDSMVVYAFRNPEIRKNNKHIDLQNDMFDEFKTGKNPDGTGNLILGYLPSKKGPGNPPIKAFGDQRKLPNDFRQLGRVARPSSTTGTISDVSERARRRYRSEYAQAETIKRGPTISGRMATGGMTPAEERNWKKREWKRRKLQEFSLNENVVAEYPSLAAAIGDKGYVKGIEYLENLDESSLENLWNETIGELMAAKKQLPAYQVRNAPLSPNELATAATVKRPLVKVFLDSYKKTSPVGELAKLDPDQMNDADIESFFNTFILPELVNNGAPTNQDVEQALLTPTTINRLDAAEQLLFVMPSNLKTLELRLKFAKYSLSQNGVSSDDPDFEQKLQELMVAQQNQDLEKLFGDIESFLSGGPNVKKIVINPRTGEKFTAEELDELIAVVSNNIEEISATFPEQDQELVQSLGMLQEIFRDTLQIQEFLKSGERNAKIPPTNPITNKPYKLREWIELGEFGLRKKPNNPLTGKPYLDNELEEHLNRVQEKLTELNNQIGTAKIAELNQQNEFLSRLMRARGEIEEVDNLDDEDRELLDGQDIDEEQAEKSQEEIEQEIQDFLDASVEFLEKDSDVLTINETDIDKAKELRKRLELESGTKKGQAELYPTNPDWWATASANIINPATGEKWGPYNGDPNHPYNNIPIDLDAQELRLPQSIYRAFLDPNNFEVKEWLDINNSHTIGRYTAQVPELSNYQGDIESLDPSKIDQRIRWDKLIPFIARVTPSWFRKKQGETVGDIDKLKARGSYGGASFSKAQFDPTVDASGYQLQAELKELFDAKMEKQEKIYLTSSSAAAKKERAKLWNLFETDGLTPSEIAFEEKILNPRFVDDALNLHMVDNNIPSARYSQALSVATQGEQTRQQVNNKKHLERTIEELRELAALFNPNLTTARDMTDVIDEEIIRLTDVAARAGADYDGFRRSYLATFYKINSLLQTRPPQRRAKYNQNGELIQTGWDINKETKAEYINRIQRWDEENINGYISESGERIPGVITQLINISRMFQTMTGDDGAASSTTNIRKVAETQKDNLLKYKSRIIETERGARAAGISGFMRTGGLTGSLGRAEEITRQAAQKAAYGQFKFANPKILRRYDVSGFDVTKRMVGNSSGFNKRFQNEIKDATRNNNKNFASRPGFEYLNSREKELIRQIDNVINSRDTRAFKRKQNRTNVGAKISNAQKLTTPEKTTRALSINPNPIFLKNRISGRMATRKERIAEFGEQDYLGPRGVHQIGIEQIGDDFYLVNRHGEILDTRKFSSYEKARAAQRKINQGFRDKRRGLENAGNIARYDAANQFIRQSGYLSYDVDLQNIVDVSPLKRNSKNIEEPNMFIIGKDAQPKQRAGDIVVIRKNSETNKLELLAIEREFGPHRTDGESTMSLPGGIFSEKEGDKDLYDTARREAFEETGLRLPENELLSLEKLGIIDSVDWDPRFAKGMEVAGLLVEVPSTWEWTPKPGTDAVVAKFVPLEDVANGNIPLGFGHIAWLEEAFGGHEDEELAELGKNFAILNVLARQRQQRVIKGANEKRRAFNDIPKPVQMELFKKELPKLSFFPDKLPDSTVGWIPTGPESTERHARRIANAQKKIRGNMSLGIGKPVSNSTGRMASGLKELGVEEFSKLSRTRRTQIIDDVYNMRKAGMDKRTITSQLAILYSAPPKNKRTSDLRSFAPTDELVFKIITDGKKRGILKIDSKSKIEPLDKYSKRVMSDHKDVMNLAKNGIKPKEISETLDISEDRVKTYLSSLGFSPESSADIMSGEIDIEKRIANTQINKSIFVDSTYGRMSVAELAKKYKMDKSKIYDSINSYRALAESLEEDNDRVYRQALETATPDLLTTDEKDIVQMRLDGLNIDEISSIKNLNQNAITDLEQTALIKLRTTNVNNFLEMDNELSIQNSRKNPTFEYMTNLLAENPKNTSGLNLFKKLKNKELAARELRDYRNIAKDFYMMNQYMGIPVDKLSRQYKITPKEVEEYIDLYSRAVNHSDKFKNKALRRAISADINNSFLDDDVNFISMRNDGASINDISRYLQVEPLTLRAKQIILMNKLNHQQGISGKMSNVPNLKNRDLYSELGISDTSSIKEIENAFQSITESLLPSAMRGDDVSFDGLKRASEAFSILGNPNYRDSYADMYKENLETIRSMELELTNNWPKSFYTEPMTGKMRPDWVRDAINGKPINSQNTFKMPHHLGSDEIIDDIDDGILGFPTNDSDKEFSISNAVYIKPVPGTKEWNKQKRRTEQARASRSSAISGKMTNLVPESSWNIGESLKKKSNSGKMSGVFDGLSAKQKEIKKQKLIINFAEGNNMLPKYSRGLPVPVPVFPKNQLDTINKQNIKKLSKIERVKEMLNFVREELANDRPIYTSSHLAEVFFLPEITISDIISGEIPNYQSKKKEITKKWYDALSAYILDNENSTLLDMADAIDAKNNESLTDQSPKLSKLRKNLFGPRVPFKKRKPKKIVRLKNGKEFTQKEYKILQRKLVEMYLQGFSSEDIDKKLDMPKRWATNQLNDLQKNKKLPKPPSPELSIIKYAAEGLTASEIMSKFRIRKNWSEWNLEKILEFVEKDGRFPDFKRGFKKIEDALDDNMVIRKSSRTQNEKKKNMNSRAVAERQRILNQRQKRALKRMETEDPAKYQERMAKRRARYDKQYYKNRRDQIKLDKISGKISISGRMGPLPRKNWTGRDFYAELNADKNDTLKTLRKKFGLIAMRDHPDKAPGDKQAAERFRKAAEAWSVLSSSEERRHYDTVVYPTLPNKQNTTPQQSGPKPPPPNPQSPKSSNPQPPRPPRPKLPPLDDSLGKQIGINLPFTKTNLPYDFYEDSFIKYSQKYKSQSGKKSFVKIPSTFGPSVDVEENRFWDVYFKIADALSGTKNTNKNPRFISVGGAPGSGKTSMRKSNFTSTDNGVNIDIPGINKAVHVDADEIKPLIPEARNAHANNLPDWASMVHEESRVISDMAIRMGIEKNQDIVYDSTGQFNRGFGTLQEARKKGYSVELHYMVASLEKTLNDRVQTRAGSDPRTMPGHIIPATLHRNKSIMHEVIDYSDKFYLWDTESKTPKLLAYKAGPNDPLIIKSPRAFLHGYLEKTKNTTPQELEDIKKMFDKPDFNLKLIPVSKKSRSASIIADFKNSKSIDTTASKFKTTPREIFDIVTKSFVDPSMKEPKIVPSPNYRGYGFPRGTNSRFNPFIPPIIFDRDLGPEDFIDTTPFDMPSFDEDGFPSVFPGVWFDELGQVEIEAFTKNQPLLSRALFSYEPKEAHVLDLIAVTNSQKKSWEARFPQGSKYDNNFVSYLREEISFDDFWDEIENDSESGYMTNTEYDDVITAILMDKDKESTRKFLEQFKDTVRNLLDVYPGSKSEPAINPFNPKNSNSVEVEETTRAIRELISNDLPYDSPLGAMWAFTYNIRLDLFEEMYNNVTTTNNIFGQQ